LHRVRGLALGQLGRKELAKAGLEQGLRFARQRDVLHEVAFGLDALIELCTDPKDAVLVATWSAERAHLTAQLGIGPKAGVPTPARDADPVPVRLPDHPVGVR
jgi:hypothetical protein